ncbi:hypothetical protein D5272_18520, partial [bacterium D16-76]|nr:hypothetical protein [bacterium D16-76]
AVSRNSETILRQIEITVKNFERAQLAERGTYGRDTVQAGGGLLNLKTVYTYSLLIHCLQIPRRNQTIQKRSFCI